jgi:hypothetical protein
VVSYQPCGNVKQLFISNLIPGSVLTIKKVVATSSNTSTITLIGSMGVSQPTATMNLPDNFSATDPNGPVSLWLEALLCNQSQGYTKVTFAPPGGPYGAPALETPLYDCVNVVVVTGTHPGTEIQVFSGTTSDPISPTVVATGQRTVVQLWTPLVTNQSIFVRQLGCNANGESKREVVKSFGKTGAAGHRHAGPARRRERPGQQRASRSHRYPAGQWRCALPDRRSCHLGFAFRRRSGAGQRRYSGGRFRPSAPITALRGQRRSPLATSSYLEFPAA